MKLGSKLRCVLRPAGFLGGLIALAWATTAMAGTQLDLDFTKPDVAKQARWTQSPVLKRGPHGLVCELPESSYIQFELQTTEPIAIGFWWRPARSASIAATLSPVASPSTTAPGQMFARYSPDTKHWSTWQVLASSTEPTQYKFSGQLVVSEQDYGEFGAICGATNDAEPCAEGILNSHPDFFAKHLPFIGYVEFLYEVGLTGGQGIERLNVDISCDTGGGNLPKEHTTPGPWLDLGSPWGFRAK
jgi:hypothetical protein